MKTNTKPMLGFNAEEVAKIRSAAFRTWGAIAYDAMQLEGWRGTTAEKVEIVADANRIETYGKLDKALAQRLYLQEWQAIVKLVGPAVRGE